MKKVKVFSPARVDLAGGTLDIYPVYLFFDNPFTLNSTLSNGIEVYIEKSGGRIEIINKNSGVSEYHPSSHPHTALVSHFLNHFEINEGYKISFFSHFPPGSSLGVSSSLLVALYYGFKAFLKFKHRRIEVVEVLKNIEARFLGYPAGVQDYLAPMFGGMNAFFFKLNRIEREKLKFDKSLSSRLIFVFTGKSHFSGSANWELFKGFFDRKKGIVEGFNLIYENAIKVKSAVEERDYERLGHLLKEDFLIRKKMHPALIPDTGLFDFLDSLEGVSGFRLCGAASGGTVAALVDVEKKKEVILSLEKKGYVVFNTSIANIGVRVSML